MRKREEKRKDPREWNIFKQRGESEEESDYKRKIKRRMK